MGEQNQKHRWAIIFAAGNGTRLKPLTRAITADDRPKQFCPIFGDRTLLEQTQRRVAFLFNPTQTLTLWNTFVMVGHLEAFLEIIFRTFSTLYRMLFSAREALGSATEEQVLKRLPGVEVLLHPIAGPI